MTTPRVVAMKESSACFAARLVGKGIEAFNPQRYPIGHEKFISARQWQTKEGPLAREVGWVRQDVETGDIAYRIYDNTSEAEAIHVLLCAESLREDPDCQLIPRMVTFASKTSGRQYRGTFVTTHLRSNSDAFTMPKDHPALWERYTDHWHCDERQSPEAGLAFSAVLTAESRRGIQSSNAAVAANWLIALGLDLNSRALITLARWANAQPKCNVTIADGQAEMAPGYAVLCHLRTDTQCSVRIAGDAPLERVLAELWRAATLWDTDSSKPLWYGPSIEPHASWCDGEHELSPHSDCFVSVGVVEAGESSVEVMVSRPRMSGGWDGDASVSVEGDMEILSPSQTAQVARLMVQGSDIAAGLFVAAAVDADRRVA